tara:strand:- start:1742 stop:1843 length:102 start_codon:yes stop_codon:yes gene_type:complete
VRSDEGVGVDDDNNVEIDAGCCNVGGRALSREA